MRSLAKDPAERPQTAQQVRSSLSSAATRAFGTEWTGAGVAASLGASTAAATTALAGGGATAAGAAAPLASQSAASGVVGATHTRPLTGKDVASHNWGCRRGKTVRLVDLAQACRWSYPLATKVRARAVNPDDATSWLCYGGPPATMTLAPTSGGSGTTIVVRSRTPCPPATQGLTVELVPLKPSPIASGQGRPLRGGDAWTADIPVGPFGSTNPPPAVQASVEAWCSLPHGLYQEYEPVTFRYTGARAGGKSSA